MLANLQNYTLLEQMIQYPSVRGDADANHAMVQLICNRLRAIGFSVSVEGTELSEQPAIIAHIPAQKCTPKIVIYGHYDVATVSPSKEWLTMNPYGLELQEGRLYGRGIADNKGPLWARIEGFRQVVASGKPFPETLWLIQGEEEIGKGTRIAKALFAQHLAQFGGRVFLEETGFNDLDRDEQIAFLWSPSLPFEAMSQVCQLLIQTLGHPRVENRHLNKFTGKHACPLLSNLPDNAIYIGFGPNDRWHCIHRENESLNLAKLIQHIDQFRGFLQAYADWPVFIESEIFP